MPWTKKRSRLFYFRSRRAGDRVVSEAVPAVDGPLIALGDALLRLYEKRVRAENREILNEALRLVDPG